MNWSRVKLILIAIFLLTDIFLAYKTYGMLERTKLSAEVIADTRQILQVNGISIKADIKRETPKLNWMVFLYEETDKKALCKKFFGIDDIKGIITDKGEQFQVAGKTLLIGTDGTIYYSDNKPGIIKKGMDVANAEKSIRNYLKGYYTGITKFILDNSKYDPEGNSTFSFMEKYNRDSNIFDNYIYIKITKDGEINVESFYVKAIGPTRESKDIIPVNEILLTGFMKDVKNLGREIIVTDIKIGYLAVINEKLGNIQSAPSWRITTDDGKEYFYNAYNGQRHIRSLSIK